MKDMKLKLVLAVAVAGFAVYSQAADIDWAGGTGLWSESTNWVGNVVPDTSFTDSAFISSGTAIYDGWISGDLWVNPGNRMVLDGGTFEQISTHYLRFFNGGHFEISNGGTLRSGSNRLILTDGGTNTVDGVGSSVLGLGPDLMAIEVGSVLSLTGGATAELTRPPTSLWNGGQFNISDNSVANLKNIEIYGLTGGRVNLFDSARLYLTGTNSNVIGVGVGNFVNFDPGCTGYIKIRGMDQATAEFMISDSKFGINGVLDTNLTSYAITTNNNVVNIGIVAPPVPDPYVPALWLGGNGDWLDTANWSGEVYPYINGTDDVTISSPTNIIIAYVPGTDFIFSDGSDLLLDGTTLYQESASWTAFYRGSTLGIVNSGAWIFESTHMIFDGQATGETTHTIDNGTLAVRELEVNDQQIVILTNGATATVTVYAAITAGSSVDVMDATLNMGEVALHDAGGSAAFINVNDGASVSLDAGFYEEGFKTNVIQKTGGSMVNFSTDTTGSVFIDSISRADVETLISQSKFGEGGTINTTVADYTILAEGAGQRIRVVPMPIGLLDIAVSGGDVVLSWDSFAGQIYQVQDRSDLTNPVWNAYTNVIGLSGATSITIGTGDAGFYQVISD